MSKLFSRFNSHYAYNARTGQIIPSHQTLAEIFPDGEGNIEIKHWTPPKQIPANKLGIGDPIRDYLSQVKIPFSFLVAFAVFASCCCTMTKYSSIKFSLGDKPTIQEVIKDFWHSPSKDSVCRQYRLAFSSNYETWGTITIIDIRGNSQAAVVEITIENRGRYRVYDINMLYEENTWRICDPILLAEGAPS